MINKIFSLSIAFLLIISAAAQPKTENQLPLKTTQNKLKELRNLTDRKLQSELEMRLNKSAKMKRLIKDKKLSVGIVDLKDPANVRYASVNGEEMMYAASLPKIAILLAAMEAMEKNELQETKEIFADLNDMIRISSNTGATRVMDLLGFKKIERVLRDKSYNLYDEELGGGLWIGKRYAKTGRRIGDPLYNISHGATAEQVCRFYYLLAFGKLVNTKRSREMLDILVNPGLKHKFVKVLEKLAPNAKLYRKSGTWKIWHSDSVLVWGEGWRKYILVGLVEDEKGGAIIEQLVPIAEDILKPK